METTPTLLKRPDGRDIALDELQLYRGCLLRQSEIVEIQQYSAAGCIPLSLMPCAIPREIPAVPVSYRRRVYGPYPAGSAEDLHTFRYAIHRGQTKLCIIEIEAIVRALQKVQNLRYILYAGAAPGEHLAFIAELFPALEIHGYDPAEFRVHTRYADFPSIRARIHTNRELFTDDIARTWRDRAHETIFISDIRSGDHTQDEFEHEVWTNMQMQQQWWRIMNPAVTLFKFRLPYTDGIVNSECTYPDGEILLQPFGPNTSTEGRLLVWASACDRVYNSINYENFYFWLNNIVREWASFECDFDLRLVKGLCHCFDCSRCIQIFRKCSHTDVEAAGLIHRMFDATHQPLLYTAHGTQPSVPIAEKRMQLAEQFSTQYVTIKRKKILSRSRR